MSNSTMTVTTVVPFWCPIHILSPMSHSTMTVTTVVPFWCPIPILITTCPTKLTTYVAYMFNFDAICPSVLATDVHNVMGIKWLRFDCSIIQKSISYLAGPPCNN